LQAIESIIFRDLQQLSRALLKNLQLPDRSLFQSSARDQLFSENHQQPYRSFSLMNADVDTEPNFFQNVPLPDRSFSGIVSS